MEELARGTLRGRSPPWPSAQSLLPSALLVVYCPRIKELTAYRDLHKLLWSIRMNHLCNEYLLYGESLKTQARPSGVPGAAHRKWKETKQQPSMCLAAASFLSISCGHPVAATGIRAPG